MPKFTYLLKLLVAFNAAINFDLHIYKICQFIVTSSLISQTVFSQVDESSAFRIIKNEHEKIL